MVAKQVDIRTGRVTTEGDDLFYEVRGKGHPLLMIAPGGGDGWQYALVAEILADEYKVITYDRRANGRSTMNDPLNFEISQQSRDALAVLRTVGEKSAFVLATAAAPSSRSTWPRPSHRPSGRSWCTKRRLRGCIPKL